MTEKLADHVYALTVEEELSVCRTCFDPIRWGKTQKGRAAPFDANVTPYGYVNHWVTCKRPPARKAAPR